MSPWQWLTQELKVGEVLGYDPWLHTKKSLQHYEKQGIIVKPCEPNLIDSLWHDKPAPPSAPAKVHSLEFAGEGSKQKRQRLIKYLQEKQLDSILLTAPDSICWLLNIRGNDVPHTPFLLCYAVVHKEGTVD